MNNRHYYHVGAFLSFIALFFLAVVRHEYPGCFNNIGGLLGELAVFEKFFNSSVNATPPWTSLH